MSTIDATSIIDSLDDILQEDLGRGTFDSFPGLDDAFRFIVSSSTGVEHDRGGRDFQINHIMEEGVSGSNRWVAVGGPTPMDLNGPGTVTPHQTYIPESSVIEWPGVGEQANPGYFRKVVTLARQIGNVCIPIEFATASKLTAAITNVLKAIIRGSAKNNALADIQAFYSRTARQEICTIGNTAVVSVNNRGTGDRITLVAKGGSVRGLHTGMSVDILDASNNFARLNTGPVHVDGVRFVPGTEGGYGAFTLQSVAASPENLNALGIAINADVIVRANSHVNLGTANAAGLGFIGPAQWLINTGPTTPFGINVVNFPQMQSIVSSLAGEAVTSTIFNRFMGRYFKSYGRENMPDMAISSPGARNAYAENSEGLGRYDITGKPLNLMAGYQVNDDNAGVYEGMHFKWIVSPFMPTDSEMDDASQIGGEVWFLKTREENLMRYVAPKLDWSKSSTEHGDEVEFIYGGWGPMGIFFPYLSTNGRPTGYLQAPFQRYVAICPKVMQGIRLTGVAESL